MQSALDLFRRNIRKSRDLIALFRVTNAQTTEALDITDILRAVMVTAVSALDQFIHEMVRLGMLEAYRAERPRTTAFLRFEVTLQGVLQTSDSFDSEVWLDREIREHHGHLSFQTPERIREVIRLFSDVTLWQEVAHRLAVSQRDVTDRLKLIVQRRNKIVHEADVMADYAGQIVYSDLRSPIDPGMVDEAVDFIEAIAEAIYSLVSLQQHETPTT